MMIEKCITDTATKLGLTKQLVGTTFKAIMKVAFDEFQQNEIFNFRIPYCGKIYKHKKRNGNKKSKENNTEIHDSDNDNGEIPQE